MADNLPRVHLDTDLETSDLDIAVYALQPPIHDPETAKNRFRGRRYVWVRRLLCQLGHPSTVRDHDRSQVTLRRGRERLLIKVAELDDILRKDRRGDDERQTYNV